MVIAEGDGGPHEVLDSQANLAEALAKDAITAVGKASEDVVVRFSASPLHEPLAEKVTTVCPPSPSTSCPAPRAV